MRGSLNSGNLIMKSNAMDDHTSPGIAGDWSLPYGLCLGCFAFAHMLQCYTYSVTFFRIPSHEKSLVISLIVLLIPGCPAVLVSCLSLITDSY